MENWIRSWIDNYLKNKPPKEWDNATYDHLASLFSQEFSTRYKELLQKDPLAYWSKYCIDFEDVRIKVQYNVDTK